MFWPLVATITFVYVPLHWRVFVFNGGSLCWNSWLAYSIKRTDQAEDSVNTVTDAAVL